TIRCDGKPVWSGSLAAPKDGTYRTEPVRLTTPGYYTYQERIVGSALVRPVQTGCGETSETTVASARLQIATSVSDQQATVGAQIHDTVVVSGLGSLSVPVTVDLWGPFASPGAIRCTGTPHWTGTITAAGDGTYQTQPVTI